MSKRVQAQQGHLQANACSQRKEPEAQRPDLLPRGCCGLSPGHRAHREDLRGLDNGAIQTHVP